MQEWLKDAWLALTALIAVVGGIAGLVYAGGWWLWAVAGIAIAAVCFASVRKAWRYIRLLRTEINGLRHEVRELRGEVADLRLRVDQSYEEGIEEGKMQWIGMSQAERAGRPPRLVELRRDGDELVLLGAFGEDQEPIPGGARYEVRFDVSGATQGVVQVRRVNQVSRLVEIVCVDRATPDFWDHLMARAIVDPTPPDGIELVPVTYPLPRVLSQSGQ